MFLLGVALLLGSSSIHASNSSDSLEHEIQMLQENAQSLIFELKTGPKQYETLVTVERTVSQLFDHEQYKLSHELAILAWNKYSSERSSLAYINLSLDIALYYLFMEQVDSIAPYLSVLEDCAMSSDNWSCQGSYYEVKGLVADAKSQFIEASRYYTKAQLIYDEADQPFKLNEINIRLGAVLTSLHECNDAKKILLPALKYLQLNYSDNSNINTISTNLGICYKDLDMQDSSLYFYKTARQFIRQSGNTSTLAILFSNMGNMYSSIEEYDLALAYIDSSLQMCLNSNIEVGVLINQINLSQVYHELGKNQIALAKLDSVHGILLKYNIPDLNQNYFLNYAHALNGLGRFEEAFQYLEKHTELKDSLEEASVKNTIEIWKSEYEKQVTEIENIQLSNTLAEQNQKYQQTWFFVVALILTSLTLLTIQHFRIRLSKSIQSRKEDAKKNAEKLLELKTKEALSQSLQMANFIEYSKDWEDRLKTIKDASNNSQITSQITSLIRDMRRKLTNKQWDEFESHLAQLNDEFYKKLLELNEDLTSSELKIAAMLKMNLSSKEIASLTGRTSGTVDNLRSQLRKKLSKEVEIQDLQAFLIAL